MAKLQGLKWLDACKNLPKRPRAPLKAPAFGKIKKFDEEYHNKTFLERLKSLNFGGYRVLGTDGYRVLLLPGDGGALGGHEMPYLVPSKDNQVTLDGDDLYWAVRLAALAAGGGGVSLRFGRKGMIVRAGVWDAESVTFVPSGVRGGLPSPRTVRVNPKYLLDGIQQGSLRVHVMHLESMSVLQILPQEGEYLYVLASMEKK